MPIRHEMIVLADRAMRLMMKTRLTPTERRRLDRYLNDLYAGGYLATIECGTGPGWHHHGDRGEGPCRFCQLWRAHRDDSEDARRERNRERMQRARALSRDPIREDNFRDLREHWVDVLDCQRRGVVHYCPTCPPGGV